MRQAVVTRKTGETDVKITLDLDGTGEGTIATGVGFMDHMLELFKRHGRFDLSVSCVGDIQVDDHHSTEDIGIALGEAFRVALGDKRGIKRYGNMLLPMDEALVLAAVDVSGRGMLVFNAEFPTEKIGTFDTELFEDFFLSLASNAGLTLHIKELDGRNSHHIAEAMFKGVARALRQAVSIDEDAKDEIPSTKGVL